MAALNASILLVGARALPASSLASLAMFQLLVATAVGLQRATILTPALAAQRRDGRAVIPYRWIAVITLPFAILSALALPILVPSDLGYWGVFVLAILALLPTLIQDFLRYAQFSRDREWLSLLSDSIWFVVLAIGLVTVISVDGSSWVVFATIWALGACVGVAVLGASALFGPRAADLRVSLRSTLLLGRWSGADAALSGAANLVPMAVATLALGSSGAAVYRVLQTASGPLNILSATFITSAGMDAWRLRDPDAIRDLRSRTHRAAIQLALASTAYLVLAYCAIVWFTGLGGAEVIRIAITLAIAGVLGGATIPFTAAAMAMGYQSIGLVVRIAVVVASVSVSACASAGWWVPWNDPVGSVALIAALCSFVGWFVGYERGFRNEARGH